MFCQVASHCTHGISLHKNQSHTFQINKNRASHNHYWKLWNYSLPLVEFRILKARGEALRAYWSLHIRLCNFKTLRRQKPFSVLTSNQNSYYSNTQQPRPFIHSSFVCFKWKIRERERERTGLREKERNLWEFISFSCKPNFFSPSLHSNPTFPCVLNTYSKILNTISSS